MDTNIAARIRDLRDKLGITQPELARRVGCDASLVSKWESGKQAPNARRMARLADLAGATISDFMGVVPACRDEGEGGAEGVWLHVPGRAPVRLDIGAVLVVVSATGVDLKCTAERV